MLTALTLFSLSLVAMCLLEVRLEYTRDKGARLYRATAVGPLSGRSITLFHLETKERKS